MRIVKQPEERKQEILENAIRVFARKGYEKTSISDIAKEMNISQGLCYRYFQSKEEIYNATLELYADYITKQYVKKWRLDSKSFYEIIAAYTNDVDNVVEVEKEQEELYAVFHANDDKKLHNELALSVADKLVPYIADSLNCAINKGEVKVTDAYATAVFFVYGQLGVLISSTIQENRKKEIIYQLLDEFLNGVKRN